jgi:hypothetical protein
MTKRHKTNTCNDLQYMLYELHLFDDLWLDNIIPKHNDEDRAIYGNFRE